MTSVELQTQNPDRPAFRQIGRNAFLDSPWTPIGQAA